MVYYDPRKPKPWPIRLANKCGITNDTTATHVVTVVAIIGIIVSGILYSNLLQGNTTINYNEGSDELSF